MDNIFPEPIKEWESVDGVPLLKLWYQDKSTFRFLLDSHIQLTIFNRDTNLPTDGLVFIERSLYSNQMVFSHHPASFNSTLNSLENYVRTEQFNTLFPYYPKINHMIYLDVPPDECFRRVLSRNRNSELSGLDLPYLRGLDTLYKKWLSTPDLPFKLTLLQPDTTDKLIQKILQIVS